MNSDNVFSLFEGRTVQTISDTDYMWASVFINTAEGLWGRGPVRTVARYTAMPACVSTGYSHTMCHSWLIDLSSLNEVSDHDLYFYTVFVLCLGNSHQIVRCQTDFYGDAPRNMCSLFATTQIILLRKPFCCTQWWWWWWWWLSSQEMLSYVSLKQCPVLHQMHHRGTINVVVVAHV